MPRLSAVPYPGAMTPLLHTFLLACLLIGSLAFLCPAAALRLLPSVSEQPPPSPTVHVFLCAGQSNSVGVNTDPKLPEDGPNGRIVQVVVCANSSSFLSVNQTYLNVSLDPMIPCLGGNLSAWRPFSRALLPTLPSSDVIVLVPTAYGGTGFINQNWNAYTGGGFQYSVQMLQRTWELLSQGEWSRYRATWAGILWHQGEADAGDNPKGEFLNSTQYLQYMTAMVEAFRNTSLLSMSRPDLPLVAGAMLQSWVDNSTYPLRQGVKVGSATLTQYIPYTV